MSVLTTAVSLNEIAKLKAAAGAGGGSGTQYNKSITWVAQARYKFTNFGSNQRAYGGSTTYRRGFNHGSGQFSFAGVPYVNGGSGSGTQLGVIPFQVDQATGALTKGTFGTAWTQSSYGSSSTCTWAQAGNYAFNFGNHIAPGQSTNYGTVAAWTVSGNAVSGGTYSVYTNYQPMTNENSAGSISGSTGYFAPCSYNSSSGTAYDWVFSYNGSSLSNTTAGNLSSNTSTQYTTNVAKQFGTTAPAGALRFWQNSSGAGQIHVLDATLTTVNTYTQSSLISGGYGADLQGFGVSLSNGNQLFYLSTGDILLRSGSSLTNVTATADYLPNQTSYADQRFTPVSADTWFVLSDSNPAELVKVRINPTTYKVTIVGSMLLANLTNTAGPFDTLMPNTSAYVTGNNNQFLVVMASPTSEPYVYVWVGQHTLTGA